jgi:hypothetical protein
MSRISSPLAVITSLSHQQYSVCLLLSLAFNSCTDISYAGANASSAIYVSSRLQCQFTNINTKNEVVLWFVE